MKINVRHASLLGAAVIAVVCVVATFLLATSSTAGSATTYTIRTVRERGSTWVPATANGMREGRLSPGDRLVEMNEILRDGRVKGAFIVTAMVASPRPGAANRAVGLMRGVYRFGDGDIYVEGFVSFRTPAASGVIVGGTGAYRGARGTFTATEAKDVLHLLP
jgi:hypothetical protein